MVTVMVTDKSEFLQAWKEYVQFTGGVSDQYKCFADWQLKNGRLVEVHPYREYSAAFTEHMDVFLRRFQPRQKECYRNAFEVCCNFPEIKYVIGYACRYIPIVHAWNSFHGFHFDLTGELALKNQFDAHIAIVELDIEELSEFVTDEKEGGCLPELTSYFNRKFLKGRGASS